MLTKTFFLPSYFSDYEQKLREREIQLQHLRRAQSSTVTELKNLKNYLRTRGESLVRLSQSGEKDSSTSSLLSAMQRAEPLMLRVSKKSLRAIPKEKIDARMREKMSNSRDDAAHSIFKGQGRGPDEAANRRPEAELDASASFGGNTTKLIAQTGFVML